MPRFSLPSIGDHRKEAVVRVLAFLLAVVVGTVEYVFLVVLSLIALVDLLYQFLTDTDGLGADDTVANWMNALAYWESDLYAYAFTGHEQPSWTPNPERHQ